MLVRAIECVCNQERLYFDAVKKKSTGSGGWCDVIGGLNHGKGIGWKKDVVCHQCSTCTRSPVI